METLYGLSSVTAGVVKRRSEMSALLDDIARITASSISRREAFRLVGGAVGGALLASLGLGRASRGWGAPAGGAQGNPEVACPQKTCNDHGTYCCASYQTCCHGHCCTTEQTCTNNVCCPSGQTGCGGRCCASSRCCNGTTCCPSNQRCSNNVCCPTGLTGCGTTRCCLPGQVCCGSKCCSHGPSASNPCFSATHCF